MDGYFTLNNYNTLPPYYALIAFGLFAVALWQGFEFRGIKALSGFLASLGLSNGVWSLSWMATTLFNPAIMETLIRTNSIGLGLNTFEPFTTYLLTTAGQLILGISGYYYTVMMK